MTRLLRLAAASVALLVMLVAAVPVSAATGTGADYGACVAHHAKTEGFSSSHNPGKHRGFAGWPGCMDA